MGEWERVWGELTGTQPPPDDVAIWASAVAALVIVSLPRSWRVTRKVVTIAHEGAHAVAAVLSGRRLAGVRVHADSSGLTLSRGKPRGPGMVATAAAGYIGPGLLGLGAAALLDRGRALAVLWLALALLALLLVQIRNFYGLYSVLVAGAGLFALTWWGSAQVQSFTSYAVTWFLLLAAPKAVVELQTTRRRGGHQGGRNSDADVLARLTRVPGLVWVGVFLVVTVGAAVLAGWWLLPVAGG